MKFARRKFLKNFIDAFGKESVNTMRSYNLADTIGTEKSDVKSSRLEIKQEELSKARPRPKKIG